MYSHTPPCPPAGGPDHKDAKAVAQDAGALQSDAQSVEPQSAPLTGVLALRNWMGF